MPRKKSTPPRDPSVPRRPNQYIPRKTLKCTFEQVKAALIEKAGFIYATADALDINVDTLYKYMKRWPELKRIIKKCKQIGVKRCEARLFDIALKGNEESPNTMRALSRILTAYNKRYGKHKEVHNIGSVNINAVAAPIVTEEVKKKILEDARARMEETKKRLLEDKRELEGLKKLENGLKELPTTNGVVIDGEVVQDNTSGDNKK